ncbi:MAG TPA: elongation factor Ts [Acidimicrobiia bacterium]|nr:elongation factor Ts [Acidimicrobiia bacterium]
MPDFTAKDIQQLRHDAGVGMMDAKKALEETGGDFEKAMEVLREKGMLKVAKRAERTAHHGTVGHYIHNQQGRAVTGVLVDLACETDFVAKSDEFVEVANDIALHISWGKPTWVERADAADAVVDAQRRQFEEEAREEGKPDELIDKIVEGKIEKYLSEQSLYEQAFVNPDKFDGTVGDMVGRLAAKMGENIRVRRFFRIDVSEGD